MEIWQDSRKLVKNIYTLLDRLPSSENFGLKSQISRAVVSIPANIAEGCAKDSQKEFVRYLQISLGSAFELETHLIICSDLNFLELDKDFMEEIHILQKRINALINYSKQSTKTYNQ